MKIQFLRSVSLAALCALVLAACGGGSGEGNAGVDIKPPPIQPPPISTYEAMPYIHTTTEEALQQLEENGTVGYRKFTEFYFSDPKDNSTIFVKDEDVTYSYQVLNSLSNKDQFLNEFNSKGSNGYIYTGDITLRMPMFGGPIIPIFGGFILRSNDKQKAKFSYELLKTNNLASDFLIQANTQGDKGFIFVKNLYFSENSVNEKYSLYVKNDQSTSKYHYIAQPAQATSKDFIDQANTHGSSGYKFKNYFIFNEKEYSVFIKDSTQAANFKYKIMPKELDKYSFMNQVNQEGKQNSVFFGFYPFSGITKEAIYFTANNCTGFLCAPTNPETGF